MKDPSSLERILITIAAAVLANIGVRLIRRLGLLILTPSGENREALVTRSPKLATIMSLFLSIVSFTVYFGAVGIIV